MIRAILTDIEGTTSSISFVKDVLFPYARERMPQFIREHGEDSEVRELLNEACGIIGEQLPAEAIAARLQEWIDEDRKLAPLKSLQGLIWEEGYRRGDFRGHVYADAAEQLKHWKDQGLQLHVFSSGSVQAQKLLFGHSDFGDLTPLFSGYFDTRIGAKREPVAYRRIAESIGMAAEEVLFLSDIEAELDAAAAAGMKTRQLLRPGTSASQGHQQCPDFLGITLES